MSRTGIADAIVAELRKLGPGEKGDMAALKAAIGCTAAELQSGIDRLRYAGKIGFYGLVLAASMRAEPEAEPVAQKQETPATDRPAIEPAGDRQTAGSKELASVPAPGGAAAQPGSPTGRKEPTEAEGAKRALPPPQSEHPTGAELARELRALCARRGIKQGRASLAIVGHSQLFPMLEAAKQPRAATVERVRAFIAEHEAPEDGGLGELAGAKTQRYRPPDRPARLVVAELIQSAMAETPEDLIHAIGRKHPGLWRRAVLLGRARGETPAAALYSALELGLGAREQEISP